jgi:phage-related holin
MQIKFSKMKRLITSDNGVMMSKYLFATVAPVIITVFVLILIDLLLGIWAAYKRNETITSAGIRRTITKIFVYEIAIFVAFLLQTYLIGETIPLVKIVAGCIGVTEALSIFENLNEINGANIFKKVLSLLGSNNDPRK